MSIGRGDLCWRPISELVPMIHRREVSPVEVAEAALVRVA